MSTETIRPARGQRLEIRCTVVDVVLSNIANHLVFFFPRRLDPTALAEALSEALAVLPIYAARATMRGGTLRIRCRGQGVPFTSASSDRTLREAIRSTADGGGDWLVDCVNGVAARWGVGPLFTVRVTRLADDATAIGVSFSHVVGDMQTLMHLMNTWSAAASGAPLPEPVIVEDRVAYLDEHLPADGAREPGVRCLGPVEAARSLVGLARVGRRLRTLSMYFGDEEIGRMRAAYGDRIRLSANDALCGHVCAALMTADPGVQHRTVALPVNLRRRCGLDPMLTGNILTALNIDMWRAESARSIAERIRHGIDQFTDQHCDARLNQRYLDSVGTWRGARCVATGFDPVVWNPLITNVSGFGVYGIEFEESSVTYCSVLQVPVAGHGAVVEGIDGEGLVFRIMLPPREFDWMLRQDTQEYLRMFRRADDDIPTLHREVHA